MKVFHDSTRAWELVSLRWHRRFACWEKEVVAKFMSAGAEILFVPRTTSWGSGWRLSGDMLAGNSTPSNPFCQLTKYLNLHLFNINFFLTFKLVK